MRFNFGFLIEASVGTSRKIEINYPTIRIENELDLTPLTGSFEAIRNSKGIYITGQFQSRINSECARCLDEVRLPITLQLDDLFYSPAHTAPPGDFGVGEDGFIDLSPLVRELSLLALPMQPTCKPDCLGLCVECGRNLNEGSCTCTTERLDPRFAQLQNLLNFPHNNEG